MHVGSERTIDREGPGALEEGASEVAEGRQARMRAHHPRGAGGVGQTWLRVYNSQSSSAHKASGPLHPSVQNALLPQIPTAPRLPACRSLLQCPSSEAFPGTLHKTAPFVTVHPCTLLHSFSVWHFS